MKNPISLKDLTVRSEIRPGDLGHTIWLHGTLYHKEYQYGPSFESYVAGGLSEFYLQYDPEKDRVWICEHDNTIIGFLLIMHRSFQIAQLRFFIILPEYRGLGLGKLLMDRFMQFLKDANYEGAFLWTTNEQSRAASLYRRYGFRLTEQKESTVFGKALMEQRYDFRFDRKAEISQFGKSEIPS
jgi:ribosomal protein S18 acetylase RimI-like enzyme